MGILRSRQPPRLWPLVEEPFLMKCFHLLRDMSTVDGIVSCLQSETGNTLALVSSPLLFSQQLVAGVRRGVSLLV